MKPTDKKWPHAQGAAQPPKQQPTAAHQFKPAVAQSKSAAPARACRPAVAPTAYRPQPHVLQRKAVQPPTKTPTAAPPVHRPQTAPPALQKKAAGSPQPHTRLEYKPFAPPAHRPHPTPPARPSAVQAKRNPDTVFKIQVHSKSGGAPRREQGVTHPSANAFSGVVQRTKCTVYGGAGSTLTSYGDSSAGLGGGGGETKGGKKKGGKSGKAVGRGGKKSAAAAAASTDKVALSDDGINHAERAAFREASDKLKKKLAETKAGDLFKIQFDVDQKVCSYCCKWFDTVLLPTVRLWPRHGDAKLAVDVEVKTGGKTNTVHLPLTGTTWGAAGEGYA